MSLDERPRGSTRPTPKVHYNSLPRTSIEGALGRLQLMNRSPLKFFLLVFAVSVPFWLIQPRDWPISASVGAPLIAALILVYREAGGGGVRRLLRRILDQWRIRSKIWYVPTIFLMPLIYLLTFGVMRLIGLPLPNKPTTRYC